MGFVSTAIEALNALPLAGLMLVVTLGWSLGRLEVREISAGPGASTLVVALLFGLLGLTPGSSANVAVGSISLGFFGFALFIYSVGFDAAPHLFSSRDRRGLRFVLVGVVVNVVAVASTVVVSRWLDLDASSAAGLLAGALTSAPTFAAASEVAPSPPALAVAFAITYPFGLLGVVLLIQLVPRMLGVRLHEDTVSDDELAATPSVARLRATSGRTPEVTRAFEVRVPEAAGRSLAELDLPRRTGCVISRLCQGSVLLVPTGESVLEVGDHLMATGRVDELREFERLVGPEVPADAFHRADLPARRIQVRVKQVTGRTLANLRILNRFHCVVTRIERGSLWIEPDADVKLVRDDVLEVVGRRNDLRALARELGNFEQPVTETDVAVYAGGILVGMLIGAVQFDVLGLRLGLGMAGGLLVVGLVLGAAPRLGPIRTHVPREARQLVRDLGILLFVGETGLFAGRALQTGLPAQAGWVFAAGLVVNVVTVLVSLLVARAALRLRPVDAWGSICGGLTSAAALHAVRRASDSNEAAISYATAYAIASVLATAAGPFVVTLLRG